MTRRLGVPDVQIPDGFDEAVGTINDVAVAAGSAGTQSAKFRALSRDLGAVLALWNLVLDAINGRLYAEINTLNYTEDSVKVSGEDLITASVLLTTTGATQVITAPAAGNHIVIKSFSYQLRENVPTVASLRAGAGGTDFLAYDLDQTGATAPQVVGRNFGSDGVPVASATALYGKLSVAPTTGGVRVNVAHVIRPD